MGMLEQICPTAGSLKINIIKVPYQSKNNSLMHIKMKIYEG